MINMKSLRTRVSQIYYTYGLMCASHPYAAIIFVIFASFIVCYPLSNLPLPGNTPLEYRVSPSSLSDPLWTPPTSSEATQEEQKRPRWYIGEPVAYVQQIVIKSVVSPWHQQRMKATDAFRAPLSSVFSILQELETFKYKDEKGERSLADICHRVAEPVKVWHIKDLLPQYSCFIVSPANFWRQNSDKFNKDPEIIKTIHEQFGVAVESPPTVKELLFGIPWKLTGITRFCFRNRQRVITYAVTIVMSKYDPKFISALHEKLETLHPHTSQNVNNSQINDLVLVHFKDTNYIVEYTPLLVTYLVLLLYLYFSVRKIDMVKSKFGLAVSAVVTVVASLLISISICTLFGLTPTLNGGEIFPYLVVIIGVENVLVITKSVVSTPVHLDVKIRVAQGLSKEGWSITKNLLSELAIMFVGFFTFVPAIQEFCAFALVGVLSDFFLQMTFFATVLSVDIRRMELSDLHRQNIQQAMQEESTTTTVNLEPLIRCPVQRSSSTSHSPPPAPSPSNLTFPTPSPVSGHRSSNPKSGQGKPFNNTTPERPRYEMPRRVKFFYFLAKFRIVQKLIMVCTVIWIILILYKTGLVGKLTGEEEDNAGVSPYISAKPSESTGGFGDVSRSDEEHLTPAGLGVGSGREDRADRGGPVEHKDLESWRKLSYKHWPTLFQYYNISLFGRYISILPTIHLSEIVDPDRAIGMRHQSEMKSESYQRWDQKEEPVTGDNESQEAFDLHDYQQHLNNFYPKSRQEFVSTVCLCILSVIIISYFMVTLYRCMCSRNYSRWRHSWAKSGRRRNRGYYKQVKESVPLVLSGHTQNIECLLSDNGLIISCCLGGQLKMWDSNSGECINTINRDIIIPESGRQPCVGRNIEDSDADLYAEYHGNIGELSSSEDSLMELGVGDGVRIRSTSSSDYNVGRGRKAGRWRKASSHIYEDIKPDLSSTINTEFSSISVCTKSSSSNGYDFKTLFEGVYDEHRQALAEEKSKARVHSCNDLSCLADNRSRSWSHGENSVWDLASFEDDKHTDQSSSVWCLATLHGLVVTGCGNGRVEVWEGETGELRYHYSASVIGVTGLCVVANKIIAARLNGNVDFLELETFHNPVIKPLPLSPKSSRQKVGGHSRSASTGMEGIKMWDEVIRCAGVNTCRAHQKPINSVQCQGGRVVTASQDHTLKVFRLDNCLCLYTLHGHESSVTALCLDKVAPHAAISGSSDGTVRIWDLLTGTCVHKFCWHEDIVMTLASSPLYIISVGLDGRMCVWDRNKSVLLHTLHLEEDAVGSAALVNRNLIVTGGQGSVSLWDIPRGSLLRRVIFSDCEQRAFVSHVVSIGNNGVVCDHGADLKVIYFPTILEKAE